MDSRQDLAKYIEDWHQSVTDRIDNLCAIYKCADVRTATAIVMTAESAVMGMFKMLLTMSDTDDPDDSEMVKMLADIGTQALMSVTAGAVELLCVDESRKQALATDIISIVKTRSSLEDTLSSMDFDDDEGDE